MAALCFELPMLRSWSVQEHCQTRQPDYRTAPPLQPDLWSWCPDCLAVPMSLRRPERASRPAALNWTVWVLVRSQLLKKAPQPAGLHWDLLPWLVSPPRPEKTPPVALNWMLVLILVRPQLLEKTPQPTGLD